jgi:hypothetical protein
MGTVLAPYLTDMGMSASRNKSFRVFVSSTFTDILAAAVFPVLSSFCARRNLNFQAIDLRWGVRDEAARDHQTMRTCLEEIAHCRAVATRPNFIVLMGHRYGWRPLPSDIRTDHVDTIWKNRQSRATQPSR